MRRTKFTCNRCGADITYPDFRDTIRDDSLVFVIEHMPRYAANKPEGFYSQAKIDLCYDCYKKLGEFFRSGREWKAIFIMKIIRVMNGSSKEVGEWRSWNDARTWCRSSEYLQPNSARGSNYHVRVTTHGKQGLRTWPIRRLNGSRAIFHTMDSEG